MKHKKGFTLGERMVAVAILSILVAVAVPVYQPHRKKAQETTCAYNRSILTRQITAEQTSGEQNDPEVLLTAFLQEETTRCPAGGSYYITYNNGQFVVACTEHGTETGNYTVWIATETTGSMGTAQGKEYNVLAKNEAYTAYKPSTTDTSHQTYQNALKWLEQAKQEYAICIGNFSLLVAERETTIHPLRG